MFPYKDENPTVLTPYVTVGIIIVTGIVWVVAQGAGTYPALARSVCELGVIPGELLGRLPGAVSIPIGPGMECQVGASPPAWHTVITSIFLHGGWFHLIGNMWFLWVFGNNVEDSMGHARFVMFYLLAGVIAALAQVFVSPSSPIPMVGASGAISGVMGGYVVLYPFVRVYVLIPLGFFLTSAALPAWTMVGYWVLIQILSGLVALGGTQLGGVAFWAHVGGLFAGVVLVRLFARGDYVSAHRATHWQPRHLGRQ